MLSRKSFFRASSKDIRTLDVLRASCVYFIFGKNIRINIGRVVHNTVELIRTNHRVGFVSMSNNRGRPMNQACAVVAIAIVTHELSEYSVVILRHSYDCTRDRII